MNKYIVTSALPYANGKLHIGHLAGAYLPADIFVRFLRLKNEDVIYVCGTDEHGAPISIKAESEGVSPKDIVNRYHKSIKDAFDAVEIEFDNFSGTDRPIHYKLSQEFFKDLNKNGFISINTTKQLYCENDKKFLADRYVEGICPYCGYEGSRGDQCDNCGKLIDATTLIKPKCMICGSTPIIKETTHWFLDLPKFTTQLKEWIGTKSYWKDNVHKFILSWLESGLIERAITRDINWGIPVPVEGVTDKVLYVWFDAPIGYISSTIEWAINQGDEDLWKKYWLDKKTKLIHFIGKDNIPFHTIIWPALIMGQDKNLILPYDVPANEYLNLEGKQLSTSRNWAIWVDEMAKDFDGEFIRYYLAANAPETKDSDFVWKDFQKAINSELANVLGNLANRVFTFISKFFDGKISKYSNLSDSSLELLNSAKNISREIESCYQNYKVRKATKSIIELARLGNRYFDERKPWKMIKEDKEGTSETLFVCYQILEIISVLFSPILPRTMKTMRNYMGLNDEFDWESQCKEINDTIQIGKFRPLFRKIEDKEIEDQIVKLTSNIKSSKKVKIAHKDNIDFEDFEKIELRLVKIIAAEKIKKSKKLLKIIVDLNGEKKTVLSGISQFYKPKDLIGKKVVMLMNLKSKKMMGEISQGMILAVTNNDKLSLLIADNNEIEAGSTIS
jgi:methionyl-tRNA synthetase